MISTMNKIWVFVIFLLIFVFSCKTGEDLRNHDNTDDKSTPQKIKDPTADMIKENTDKRMIFTIEEGKTSETDMREFIKNLFTALEEKIAKKDFDGWYSAISRAYRYYISDPVNLRRWSVESDYLSTNNITLNTPKDYFFYVVVESRKGKQLKFFDYKYIDKFHINVICVLDESSNFTYNFIYEDNAWRLDR